MSKNDGKRKERKAVIEKYLGGLFARTEGYTRNVSRYYTAAVEALLDLAATADMKPDEVFRFSDHKRMSVKATNILRGLYSAVYQEIRRGVTAEWEYANLSADAMITSLFGKGVMEDNHFARWFARNQEAMDSFFSRKDAHGGLNLSQKVWKYTGQFKEEMELALSASLGQGDSAATVSRHVRQYLREPDRLFRRVRDAQGNLKLSKRAAAYHPGRGEYRSSYKNAMRLTRTETNMAYRAADCDRWSRIPFVVGMEVKRSNHPFGCEVCEALKGKYPKDFVFTGWHPQCRCYIVPVLASEEERMAYHRAVLNGEDVSDFHFKGEITEPHEGFRKWMGENQERIENAKSLPYWIKDNGKYVGVKEKNIWEIKEDGIRTDEKIKNGSDVPVPDNVGRIIEISHDEIIARLRELSKDFTHEEAFVELTDGRVYHKIGEGEGVNFSDEEKAMFRGGKMYHNHGRNPLSPNDIAFMYVNKLKSISAITTMQDSTAYAPRKYSSYSYTYIVEKLSKKADDNVWEEMQRVNSIKSDEIRRNMQFYCAKELCKLLKVKLTIK